MPIDKFEDFKNILISHSVNDKVLDEYDNAINKTDESTTENLIKDLDNMIKNKNLS